MRVRKLAWSVIHVAPVHYTVKIIALKKESSNQYTLDLKKPQEFMIKNIAKSCISYTCT